MGEERRGVKRREEERVREAEGEREEWSGGDKTHAVSVFVV